VNKSSTVVFGANLKYKRNIRRNKTPITTAQAVDNEYRCSSIIIIAIIMMKLIGRNEARRDIIIVMAPFANLVAKPIFELIITKVISARINFDIGLT
jgi:hypothetical protein